jgi:hypothetical protein
MRIQSIPDNDHWSRDVPVEVAEGHQDIRRADGMFKMSLVDLAGERQANSRGQLPPLAHAPQDGRGAISWVAIVNQVR